MKISVVQPPYYAGEHPDEKICEFLLAELEKVEKDGQILAELGGAVGSTSAEVDPKEKYMRTAGFGEGLVRNDDFIANGLCPEAFA